MSLYVLLSVCSCSCMYSTSHLSVMTSAFVVAQCSDTLIQFALIYRVKAGMLLSTFSRSHRVGVNGYLGETQIIDDVAFWNQFCNSAVIGSINVLRNGRSNGSDSLMLFQCTPLLDRYRNLPLMPQEARV